MQADLAHLFAEARHFLGADRDGRFRCDVASGWAGAAGRNDRSQRSISTSSISAFSIADCSSGIKRVSIFHALVSAEVNQACSAGMPSS